MKKRRPGFLLVACLLLLSVMMVMGLGLMSSRASRYEAAVLTAQTARARALAWAGLEATRVKLCKDLDFPPPQGEGSLPFQFTEQVLDLDGSTRLGSYTVTVDSSWKHIPYQVLQVTSLGNLGPADGLRNPQVKIVAELDLSPRLRSNPAAVNPDYFRWIVWSEEGSY